MNRRRIGSVSLIVLLAAAPAPLAAQDFGAASESTAPYRLMLQPESRLWFKGGSTVRGFECQATAIEGRSVLEIASGERTLDALGQANADVTLEFPVAALDCDNGTMNDHMHKALEASKHPVITYRHKAHEIVPTGDGAARAKLTGSLTIAGQERDIVMEAEATLAEDGALRLQGSHELDMTEWGVKPPRLMLGTLKVHDDVTIYFDFILRP